MKLTSIEIEDATLAAQKLTENYSFPEKSSWLITGASGFIGSQLLNTLKELRKMGKRIEVTILENGSRGGVREWYFNDFNHINCDVSKEWPKLKKHDFIVHLASIASPVFYREFPLETLDANINGTRLALEHAKEWGAKLLILSSSEIYGDPDVESIPTLEIYNGNVDCTGPRACYDESKRVAETLAWIYQHKFGVNVSVARPFNFYGPGMRLDDGRILPDLFEAAVNNKDMIIRSDGTPTRTFCYIRDAIIGLVAIALCAEKKQSFNIGRENEEISINKATDLVSRIAKRFGWANSVVRIPSAEAAFLINNPKRRAPNTEKIYASLNWKADVDFIEGVERSLNHFHELKT
jgi:UDP-glucuronate decarboxylase